MSILFGIVKQEYILGNESRITYGIAVYAHSEATGTATVLRTVSDISTDRDRIEELVDLCNRLELSAEQIDDIVEDFIISI